MTPSSLKKANILLGLQFLSDFGDSITTALLALCVLDITQSTEKVGFVYVFTILGFTIFTLVGGYLGDALSRRNILFCADVGRGIVVLLLILAVDQKSIALIYATSFLLSTLGSLHGPVKISIWAEAIPSNFLERYNNLSQLSIQSSSIFGPLIASFLVLQNWTTLGFMVDAITFFICAIVFVNIIGKQNSPREIAEKRNFLQGFNITLRAREIRKYVAYDAIQMIGFGAFNGTFLILAQRDYLWTKAEYSIHLFIIALLTTIGAIIGAVPFVERISTNTKLTGCALISALTLYIALVVKSFPLASIFVGICDGAIVLTMAVARTKVQLAAVHAYPQFLSSIIAARSIIIRAATLLGMLICLGMEKYIGLEATLMLLVLPIGLSFVPLLSAAGDAQPVENLTAAKTFVDDISKKFMQHAYTRKDNNS